MTPTTRPMATRYRRIWYSTPVSSSRICIPTADILSRDIALPRMSQIIYIYSLQLSFGRTQLGNILAPKATMLIITCIIWQLLCRWHFKTDSFLYLWYLQFIFIKDTNPRSTKTLATRYMHSLDVSSKMNVGSILTNPVSRTTFTTIDITTSGYMHLYILATKHIRQPKCIVFFWHIELYLRLSNEPISMYETCCATIVLTKRKL